MPPAPPNVPHTRLIMWSFPGLPSQERDVLAATAEGASRLRFKSQELTQVLHTPASWHYSCTAS